MASRNEYDKTISETEAAYLKARAARARGIARGIKRARVQVADAAVRAQILESSQTLLTVLKRETVTCVAQRTAASGTRPVLSSSVLTLSCALAG